MYDLNFRQLIAYKKPRYQGGAFVSMNIGCLILLPDPA